MRGYHKTNPVEPREKISLTVPASLAQHMKDCADEAGLSLNAWVRQTVQLRLEEVG